MLRALGAATVLALVVIGGAARVSAAVRASDNASAGSSDLPKTAPQAVARAAELVEQGREADARALLEHLIEQKPRYGPARLELGRLALERGSWQEALEHLEIAVAVTVRREFLAWHLLGRARLLAGRPEAAVEAFEQALVRAPRFAPALVGRAAAAFLLGELEVAEAEARRAVTLEGAQGMAEALLTAILAASGRQGEAQALHSASGNGAEGFEAFRRLLEWMPGEPRILAAAAEWALGIGALTAAECLGRQALAADVTEARLLEILARVLIAGGRSEDAAVSIRRAVELGDTRAGSLALLGRTELALMRIEEAIAAYRRALELDPSTVDEIPTTALTALAEEVPTETRGALDRHLEAHSMCPNALYLMGQAARRDGDLEAATSYFERLVALDETSATHYVLAGLFRQLGQAERSQAELDRFRERKRDEDAEWLRQNDAFRRRLEAQEKAVAEPREAVGIYRGLAAEDLATGDDYVDAGRLLLELGLAEEARGWFERVLAREPFRKDALEGFAQSFEGTSVSDAARQVRQRLEWLAWACAPIPSDQAKP